MQWRCCINQHYVLIDATTPTDQWKLCVRCNSMKNDPVKYIVVGAALVTASFSIFISLKRIVKEIIYARAWQIQHPAQVSLFVYLVAAITFILGVCLVPRFRVDGYVLIITSVVLSLISRFAIHFLLAKMGEIDNDPLYVGWTKIALFAVGSLSGATGIYILIITVFHFRTR